MTGQPNPQQPAPAGQRRDGWYWVKRYEHDGWIPDCWGDGLWTCQRPQPFIVGPRIPSPDDATPCPVTAQLVRDIAEYCLSLCPQRVNMVSCVGCREIYVTHMALHDWLKAREARK